MTMLRCIIAFDVRSQGHAGLCAEFGRSPMFYFKTALAVGGSLKNAFKLSLTTFCLSHLLALSARAEDLTPVVFAPGMGVPASITKNFEPLYSIFKRHGYELLVSLSPAGSSIEERSEKLMQEIDRLVPATKKFHIIGHSMGGLDARRVIQRYQLGSRVISLTTISTPHRGTALADYLVESNQGSSNPLSDALKNQFKELGDAGKDLTTWHMQQFNQEVIDDAEVFYFSLGFYIPQPVQLHTLSAFNWWTWGIIKDRGQALNDSMVSVDSAQWGTYLGTFKGEHIAQTLPVLYDGHFIYEDTFERVLNNLDRRFK